MATIRDVAKRAGVSVSAVSCVLNNRKNVSLQTYERIVRAMQDLNYRPSFFAQNIGSPRNPLLGVVLPELHGRHASIFSGVSSVAAKRNYHTVLKLSNYNHRLEKQAYEALRDLGVRGIVFLPASSAKVEDYRDWVEKGPPIVFLENRLPDLSFTNVSVNNRALGQKLAEEAFRRHDYRKCVLVTGSLNHSSQREFYQGVMDALTLETGRSLGIEALMHCQLREEHSVMHIDLLDYFSAAPRDLSALIFSSKHASEYARKILDDLALQPHYYFVDDKRYQYMNKARDDEFLVYRDYFLLGECAATKLLESRPGALIENADIVIDEYLPRPNRFEWSAAEGEKRRAPNRLKRKLRVLLLEANAVKSISLLKASFERQSGYALETQSLPHSVLMEALFDPKGSVWEDFDLFMVDLPWMDHLISHRRLEDFGALLSSLKPNHRDLFPERLSKQFYSTEESTFGLPVLLTCGFLYYRKDLFENQDLRWRFHDQAGFELNPPTNWLEYNLIAEFFLHLGKAQSNIEFGTAIPAKSPVALMEEFYVREWAYNGKLVDAQDHVCFDSVENLRAVDNLLKAYELSPPESLQMFYEETFKLLLQGKIAFTQGFATHYLPYRYNLNEQNYHPFIEVAPIPGGKSMAGGWFLCVNRRSREKEAAVRFILWVLSEEVAVQNAHLGGAIPLKSVMRNSSVHQKYPWWKIFDVERIKLRQPVFDRAGRRVNTYDIERMMASELEKTLLKEQTATETLKVIHRQLCRLKEGETL